MDSFTESEISQIARLERDAGVRVLSGHFQWPEFCDERLRFHQEFVYDVAMFAADQGFSWPNVIRSAVLAKNLFPQMDGLDVLELSSLLRDVLGEHLPNLSHVHQHEFTRFLVDTCVIRRRLFQAVVGGMADESISLIDLELQLPPEPRPLAQATDLLQRENQTQPETDVAATLQQKEEELRRLRDGPRVTLGDVPIPEDGQLDGQSTVELVRTAVRGAEGQMLASLTHEASLLADVTPGRVTGERQKTAPQQTSPGKGKKQTAKPETGTKGKAK